MPIDQKTKVARQLEDRELQAKVHTATTVAELEAVRAKLLELKLGIEQQLSTRNRTDEFGQRLADVDYWKWRDKATFAVAQLSKGLSQSKIRLKKMREEIALQTQGMTFNTNTPKDLLLGAYALLRKLEGDVEFSPSEYLFLDALRSYVERHTTTEPSAQSPDKVP